MLQSTTKEVNFRRILASSFPVIEVEPNIFEKKKKEKEMNREGKGPNPPSLVTLIERHYCIWLKTKPQKMKSSQMTSTYLSSSASFVENHETTHFGNNEQETMRYN